jgi:hypothetical protein
MEPIDLKVTKDFEDKIKSTNGKLEFEWKRVM